MSSYFQNNMRKEFVVSQAFSCLFASLLFLTINEAPIWLYRGIGLFFLSLSLFLVISPLWGWLLSKSERTIKILGFTIQLVTLALVIIALVQVKEVLSHTVWLAQVAFWGYFVFVLLFFVQFVFSSLRPIIVRCRKGETKVVAGLLLKTLAMVAAVASLALVLQKAVSVEVIIIILAIGLLAVSISLLSKPEE